MQSISTPRRRAIQSFSGLALYFGLGSAAVFTSRKSFAQATLTPSCGAKTPAQLEGPFFTPNSPERSNLISTKDKAPKIQLSGEVLDQLCRPVQGAMLDFWQSEKGRVRQPKWQIAGASVCGYQRRFFSFVANARWVHRPHTTSAR